MDTVYGKPYQRSRRIRRAEWRLKQIRNYQAAMQNRLTADWLTSKQAADTILRWQLPKLRERSRDLWRNNDYAKAFGRKLKTNVIGSQGIILQNKARIANGQLDKTANQQIEDAFERWSDPKNCTVTGRLSRHDLDKLVIENVARDGEVFIQKIRGFDNEFGFALQLIDADQVDIDFNEDSVTRQVIMGIEVNDYGRPVQYWLKGKNGRFPVPAERMIHLFDQDRIDQHRGVPWVHTAILRLRSLGAYEEAAIIAARVGASGMGVVLKPKTDDDKYTGETDGENLDSGAYLDNVSPGAMLELPPGSDFKTYDPAYPASNHADFMKAVLKGAAAGLGISYNSISGDLEGVNFSSIRQGVLEDRDVYKDLTKWQSTHVHNNYFKEWLALAALTNQVSIPIKKTAQFARPKWQGRGFDWIDPLKDAKGKETDLNNYVTSPQRIAAERGVDIEDILDDHQAFNEMLAARKLKPRGENEIKITEPAEADGAGDQ